MPDEHLEKAIASVMAGKTTVDKIEAKYSLTPEQKSKLTQ